MVAVTFVTKPRANKGYHRIYRRKGEYLLAPFHHPSRSIVILSGSCNVHSPCLHYYETQLVLSWPLIHLSPRQFVSSLSPCWWINYGTYMNLLWMKCSPSHSHRVPCVPLPTAESPHAINITHFYGPIKSTIIIRNPHLMPKSIIYGCPDYIYRLPALIQFPTVHNHHHHKLWTAGHESQVIQSYKQH